MYQSESSASLLPICAVFKGRGDKGGGRKRKQQTGGRDSSPQSSRDQLKTVLSSLSAKVLLVSPDSIDGRFHFSQITPMGTYSSVCEERATKRPHCPKRFYADIFYWCCCCCGFQLFFSDQSQGSVFAGKTAYGPALMTYIYYFLNSPPKENASFPWESVIYSAFYGLFSLQWPLPNTVGFCSFQQSLSCPGMTLSSWKVSFTVCLNCGQYDRGSIPVTHKITLQIGVFVIPFYRQES